METLLLDARSNGILKYEQGFRVALAVLTIIPHVNNYQIFWKNSYLNRKVFEQEEEKALYCQWIGMYCNTFKHDVT